MSLPINSGGLSPEHMQALEKASPGAEEILANMDDLNSEIADISTPVLPEDSLPSPVRAAPARRSKKKTKNAGSRKQTRAQRKIAEAAKKQAERGEEMNLDSELDALDEQLNAPAEAEQQAPEGQSMQDQVLQLLKDAPNAPTEKQIAMWKRQHGKNAVHLMGLGEGDVYIFTHLKRGQWKKIQELMAKAQQTGAQDVEDQLKEKVIQHCVMWPQLGVEFFYNSRAGIVDSLYQVILLNSYFLSPQQAMLLTTQL